MKMINGVPRRAMYEHLKPEEIAIIDIQNKIDSLGCDERLTDCIMLLSHARDRIGDYFDENE